MFEYLLCGNTIHNYYGAHDIQYMMWETSLFPPSDNFCILKKHNSFSMDIDFDLVVYNSRLDTPNKPQQYNAARVLSDALHVPMLGIAHAMPLFLWGEKNSESRLRNFQLCSVGTSRSSKYVFIWLTFNLTSR